MKVIGVEKAVKAVCLGGGHTEMGSSANVDCITDL